MPQTPPTRLVQQPIAHAPKLLPVEERSSRHPHSTLGITISKDAPYTVLGVHSLMDKFGVRQGKPGYANTPLELQDRIVNVGDTTVSDAPLEVLKDEMAGPVCHGHCRRLHCQLGQLLEAWQTYGTAHYLSVSPIACRFVSVVLYVEQLFSSLKMTVVRPSVGRTFVVVEVL